MKDLRDSLTFFASKSKGQKISLQNIQVFELYLDSIKLKPTMNRNCISDVMVSMFASSTLDHGFKGQTKDYDIGICYFSTKRSELWSKSKDWLAWNQDNVSEWRNKSTFRL